MPTQTTEYRPSVFLGLAFAAIFAVTAVILIWLGTILSPDDRAAMDGAALLLFTVVPIRLFAWTFAAVFMFFGFRIARRALTAEPTLVVSEASVTLPGGRVVPWARVMSARANQHGLLVIEVADEQPQRAPPRAWRSWLGRFWRTHDENQVVMSAYELGAHPAAVATELESKRAVALREGNQV